jgi:predicted permease
MRWAPVRNMRNGLVDLVRHPKANLAAVATLALGIGTSAVMFNIIRDTLIHPVPLPHAGRLVVITEFGREAGVRGFASPGFYFDLRDQKWLFEEVGAFQPIDNDFTLATSEGAIHIFGTRASSSLFQTLGVRPALGRTFLPEEDTPTGDDVAILSDRLWRSQFGAKADVVGEAVRVNGRLHTVVGVLPATLNSFAERYDLWFPLHLTPVDREKRRGGRHLRVIARLMPRITPEGALGHVSKLYSDQRAGKPALEGWDPVLQSLEEYVTESTRPTVLVLIIGVLILLLIACVNFSNLLLVRWSWQERDFAIHAAVGATAADIVALLLTESVAMALSAGLASCLIAPVCAGLVARALFPGLEQGVGKQLDAGVVTFTLTTAGVIGVACALIPAFRMARLRIDRTLRSAGKGIGTGHGLGMRRALVAVQISLAVALVATAGVLTKSVNTLLSVDPGFDAHNAVAISVTRNADCDCKALPEGVHFYEDILSALQSLPGVESAGLVKVLPFKDFGATVETSVEGQSAPPPSWAVFQVVSPGYFSVMRSRLLAGRNLGDADGHNSSPVAVINESMARQYWPGEHLARVVGRRFRFNPRRDTPWTTVVGVVRDMRQRALETRPMPEAFLPFSQMRSSVMRIVLRTKGDVHAFIPTLRSGVRAYDKGLPITEVLPIEDLVSESTSHRRTIMMLVSSFGAFGVVLAATGVYTVTAAAMSRRRTELAIRMALGADLRSLLELILGDSARLALIGSSVGVLGALALGYAIRASLYGVTPYDPWVLVISSGSVVAIALGASAAPALAAGRIDPAEIVRST